MTKIYFIIHQHWDPAWAFRRKHTMPQFPKFFEDVLDKLERHPSYKFVLDGQTHIVEKWLEQFSRERAKAKRVEMSKFVKEKRLAIGPFYSQIDWNLTNGEVWIRNLLIGHKDAEEFGRVMKVGWVIDIFGFPDAMPRILKGFGIDSVFLSRGIGVKREEVRDVYRWNSCDGTEILCFHLIESYRNAVKLAEYPEIAEDRVRGELKALLPYSSTGKTILLLDGYENSPEADDVIPLIEKLNWEKKVGEIIVCTPEEYVEAIRKHGPSLTRMSGYLYHGKYATALRGVFSSRVGLKQKYRKCETALVKWVEPLTCMLWCFGDEHPKDLLDEFWRSLLEAAFHDEICGCHVDDVSGDLERLLGRIENECEEIVKRGLEEVARNVNTSGTKGMSLVVFNFSPWRRKDVSKVIIELPERMNGFSLRDGKGNIVPFQVGERKGEKIEIWFLADIPPLGYKTYNIFPEDGAEFEVEEGLRVAKNVVENKYIRVKINDDGSLAVWDKKSGYRYDKLAHFKSEGEAGDLYTSFCLKNGVCTSLEKKAEVTLVEKGPLAAKFKIRHKLMLPESLSENRESRLLKLREYPIITHVELTAGSPRVDIRTRVNNTVRDHRFRVRFPSNLGSERIFCGQQFDVAKFPTRPDTTGYSSVDKCPLEGVLPPQWDTGPADGNVYHGFIDLNDGEKGLCLISKDTYEYWVEPDTNTAELTLIRGVGWLGAEIPIRAGRAGWGIKTPDAQCLEKHTFEYSILPHSGGWFDAKLHVEASNRSLNLAVVQTDTHPGSFPSEFGFIEVGSKPEGALEITCVKRSEDGKDLIVRFYNYSSKRAEGEVKIAAKVKKAYLCDLKEDIKKELPVKEDVIYFKAEGKGIITLRVQLSRKKLLISHGKRYAKFIPQTLSYTAEDERWLEAEVSPLITEDEIRKDEVKIKEVMERIEEAERRFKDVERRGLCFSQRIEDKLKFWQAKLEMIKLIEKKKDAEYSFLLDKTKHVKLTEKKKAVRERKLKELQVKIDELAKGLMDPRKKSQIAHHVVNCYKLLKPRQ